MLYQICFGDTKAKFYLKKQAAETIKDRKQRIDVHFLEVVYI